MVQREQGLEGVLSQGWAAVLLNEQLRGQSRPEYRELSGSDVTSDDVIMTIPDPCGTSTRLSFMVVKWSVYVSMCVCDSVYMEE